jgi:hypothetical protein
VRAQEHRAEQYTSFGDSPFGNATICDPKDIRTGPPSMRTIFLLDRMKREVADSALDASVSDDQIDGRPLKVLNIALAGLPDSLMFRYWIDLKRNGHVVRQEEYLRPNNVTAVASRLDITLASFKAGKAEVWMPVSGESMGYMAVVDSRPTVMKTPQAVERTYVVDGTMEFNRHPGPEVLTIKYRPGTPVSDNLRQLEYEFGQQKVPPNPNKREVESLLKEQLAEAEKQKATLVVASTSEGSPWSTWLAWGFGTLVVVSSIALWIQRRGH